MKIKIAIMALAVVVGLATTAQAAPIALRLTDGTNTVTILDGGAGDANSIDGVVTWVGTLGAWTVNVSTGLGTGTGPDYMDLNSVNTSFGPTTSTLSIFFTQQNNPVAFPGFTLQFGGTTTNASVTTAAMFSNTNALFTGTTFATLGPFSGAFSGTTSGSTAGATAPYSLTQAFFITGDGSTNGSSFSGDAELNPVPEPGSMLLIGSGLLGLAGMARRRMRKSA